MDEKHRVVEKIIAFYLRMLVYPIIVGLIIANGVCDTAGEIRNLFKE